MYFNLVQRDVLMQLHQAVLTTKLTSSQEVFAFENAILQLTLHAVQLSKRIPKSIVSQYFVQSCIEEEIATRAALPMKEVKTTIGTDW